MTLEKNLPPSSNRRNTSSLERDSSEDKSKALSNPTVIPSISEKDKKLKERVLRLCRLPPDFAVAAKWFRLAKEIESYELRQLVLKASGAALILARKQNIYYEKVKPILKDALLFEKLFHTKCLNCGGMKVVGKKCTSCAGSGICRYSNCIKGRRLVQRIRGSYYAECRECKGSGACLKCGATGIQKSRCTRCNSKGVVFNCDAAVENYQTFIQGISQLFM